MQNLPIQISNHFNEELKQPRCLLCLLLHRDLNTYCKGEKFTACLWAWRRVGMTEYVWFSYFLLHGRKISVQAALSSL